MQYFPEKYFDLQIISKPNYEILENCNTKSGKVLIIFNPNNRNECHEYRLRKGMKIFRCLTCESTVNIHKENDFIELLQLNHGCEYRNYDREKYFKFKNFVSPGNFEIHTEMKGEREKKTLIIFDENDRTKCFIYSFRLPKKIFKCINCEKQNVWVSAKLQQNSEGENYVILSNAKHVCEMVKYEPQKYAISKIDTYFYYRNKRYPNSVNVAIFDSNDSSFCYPFFYQKSKNNFRCSNCLKLMKNYCIPFPKIDENGKEYFIHDPKKHICKPIKISSIQKTSKFQRLERKDIVLKEKVNTKEVKIDETRILKLPNFEFRPSKNGKPDGKLVIFDTNDKSLCYEYCFLTRTKYFICKNCERKKHQVTAKLHLNNETNEKFVELSEKQHICEPIKDDKIIDASNFIVTERNVERKPKKLIVFTSEKKEYYYELTYSALGNCFRCIPCSNCKKSVGAKLCKKENGEEYLMKMKNDHVCTPKKYEKEKLQPKTIPKSMFELYKNKNGESNKKLIVFTSEIKDFVYEYYWHNSSFCCSQCLKQNKCVSAKVRGDNENEKFVELSKVEHVCTPKKYEKEKLQPKTIPKSMFELYKNKNGESNKKLIVFTSEKKDFVYEYFWNRTLFRCLECWKQNKYVNAKIRGENENEAFVELSNVEHICKQKKFVATKYKK